MRKLELLFQIPEENMEAHTNGDLLRRYPEFVEAFQAPLVAHLQKHILPPVYNAEDVAQDAFTSVFQYLQIHPDKKCTNPKALIFHVARRRATEVIRRHKTDRHGKGLENIGRVETAGWSFKQIIDGSVRQELADADPVISAITVDLYQVLIDRCTELQRDVIKKLLKGWTRREMEEVLPVSVRTIDREMIKIRDLLADMLGIESSQE